MVGGAEVFQSVKEQGYGQAKSIRVERWLFRVAGSSFGCVSLTGRHNTAETKP